MVVLRKVCLTKNNVFSSEFEKWEHPCAEVPDTAAWQNLRGGFRFFYSANKASKHAETFFYDIKPSIVKKLQKRIFRQKFCFRALPDIRLTSHFWSKTLTTVRKNLKNRIRVSTSPASWIPALTGCLYPNLGTGGARVNSFLTIGAWHCLTAKCQAVFFLTFFTI